MTFLDLKKKKWVIKGKEYDVIEDVPMKDLNWFKDKLIEAEKEAEKGKTGTKEEVEFEKEWFNKVCEMGLGTSYDEILDTGISSPDFRELMAEVYTFLSSFGTIERAKLSDLFVPKTQKKENKR